MREAVLTAEVVCSLKATSGAKAQHFKARSSGTVETVPLVLAE